VIAAEAALVKSLVERVLRAGFRLRAMEMPPEPSKLKGSDHGDLPQARFEEQFPPFNPSDSITPKGENGR
jgi:hypothetical protein